MYLWNKSGKWKSGIWKPYYASTETIKSEVSLKTATL